MGKHRAVKGTPPPLRQVTKPKEREISAPINGGKQMPNFTPGPWTATKGKFGFPVVNGPQYEVASPSFCGENMGSLRGNIAKRDEIIANALLIAAAPEIYEALRKAAGVLTGEVMSKSGLIDALEAVSAAMSKAEGRQP